jgi:AAA domain
MTVVDVFAQLGPADGESVAETQRVARPELDPRAALDHSRVDVIAMIDEGIPPRAYVPGADGLLPKGKRVHVAAEKKTGKSLAMCVVTAIQIVAAGGSVAVLDRENGADEFARRLEAVLDARGADDTFRERVRVHLRYHAWPAMRLDWADDPAYPAAFGGVDVVIFDSSRSHLTPLGLKEDLSDDFAQFTTALIDPLMRAGITTINLDNTGHNEKGRARGTSAKEDLCDIAFTMRTLTPFTSTNRGRLELRCTASRLGEVGGVWHMKLGGGHYGAWEKIGARPPEAREELREAALEVLLAAGETLGSEKIGDAIRARPGNTLKFGADALRAGLKAWAADPATGVVRGPSGVGFTAHVERPRHDPHVETVATRLDTAVADTAETPASTGDMSMSDRSDTTRHGGHVVVSSPYGGDTTDKQATEDGYHGWSDDELQAMIDGVHEVPDTARQLEAETS